MEAHTDDAAYEYGDDDYYYDDNSTGGAVANFTFSVEDCPASALGGAHIFVPALYYLVFFAGFLGNLFVISVVGVRGRRGGRLVDTFVVNLAVADLVFVLTLPLWAVSAGRGGSWDFGEAGGVLCKLSSYVIAVNRFANIFFLTCMSVDRYLVVVKLMDSRYLRRSWCIRGTCAAVWLSSLALGVPSLVYRGVEESGGGLRSCREDSGSAFFLGLSLAMTFLTFVFPVLTIVLCYGTIITHLNRHCAAAANPRAEARRRHSLKMVLSIIVAFVASWLPFNVFKVLIICSQLSAASVSCETLQWQSNGLLVSCCLAFLNSCVNPAIYFFLDHHFRRRAEGLLRGCVGRSWPPLGYSSSASLTNAATESLRTSGGGTTQLQLFE